MAEPKTLVNPLFLSDEDLRQGTELLFFAYRDFTARGDVWHYIQLHKAAYNPLHDQFFPSIGCALCTRAISLGEDFRAGR